MEQISALTWIYASFAPVVFSCITIFILYVVDEMFIKRFIEPYANILSLKRKVLKLNAKNFVFFIMIGYLNYFTLGWVFSYVTDFVTVPDFPISIKLVVSISLTLLPRLLAVTYSRERAKTTALALSLPYSLVFSFLFLYTPIALIYSPEAISRLLPAFSLSEFLFLIPPLIGSFLITEVGLTKITRIPYSERKLSEILKLMPSTGKLLIGRNVLYTEGAKMLNKMRESNEVIGLVGTFSLGEATKGSSTNNGQTDYEEALKQLCKHGVNVRYIGPIDESNYKNAQRRESIYNKEKLENPNCGKIEIRHVNVKEGFARILVADNDVQISIPIKELPEECQFAFKFEKDEFLAHFAKSYLESLWIKGQPLKERMKIINKN